jgi:arylsulfatase A-like enzyme
MAGLVTIGLVVVALIARPHRPTSVVVVVLDTVRADHCSAYGYGQPTTPRLARLAAEGLLFEQARAVAPWTLPSHASLFTGRLPSQHGCTWEHRWLLDRFDTLAETLGAAGMETFGATTNPNVSSLYNLQQGFTTFVESWMRREQHHGLDDSAIANAEIAAWLDRRDARTPFFLFVNYADAHLPYAPPPPRDRQFGEAGERARALARRGDLLQATLLGKEQVRDDDRAGLAALYDGDVRTADARLGELLDLLEQHDLADDTLVIVTSDHGESLGEEGRVDHQLGLMEELLRVPLVVRFPGRIVPARIPEPVALTDVKAWIDEIVDGRVPEWSAPPDRLPAAWIAERDRAVDLVELLRGAGRDPGALDARLFAAWRPDGDGATKLLRQEPGGESWWRVDRDGRETAVAAAAIADAEALRTALAETLKNLPYGEDEADWSVEPPPDARTLAQLAKLGYVAAPAGGGVGLHASEHWSAGRRAAARGEVDAALAEFAIATALSDGQAMILLDAAKVADTARRADAGDAIERFLRAVGNGQQAPADAVAWAKQRLDERRRGGGP